MLFCFPASVESLVIGLYILYSCKPTSHSARDGDAEDAYGTQVPAVVLISCILLACLVTMSSRCCDSGVCRLEASKIIIFTLYHLLSGSSHLLRIQLPTSGCGSNPRTARSGDRSAASQKSGLLRVLSPPPYRVIAAQKRSQQNS